MRAMERLLKGDTMRATKRFLMVVLAGVMLVSVGLPHIATYADSTVYITATGEKYHYSKSCRGLRRARKIYETTLSEAQSRGFTACAICANGVPGTSGGSGGSSGTSQSTAEEVRSMPVAEETASAVAVTTLAKGDVFEKGGIQYKVTDAESKVVKVIGSTKSLKKITIPATVEKDGDSYAVMAIGEGSFQGMSSATALNVAGSVSKIGKNVFKDCGSLKSISISMDGTQSIGSGAFSGIAASAKVKIRTSKDDSSKYQAFVKKLQKAGATDATFSMVSE